MPSYQEKRRMELGKRCSIDAAYRAVKAKEYKPRALSEDAIARKDIQTSIRELCYSVKTRSKILEILNDKFSDDKYAKYRPYFKSWVTDVLAKLGYTEENETEKIEHIEDEER